MSTAHGSGLHGSWNSQSCPVSSSIYRIALIPSGRSTSKRLGRSHRPPVRERLRRIVERIGVPSRRTYTARGARLTEDSRLPVWTRSQDKNRISYGLNAEHPLFAAFEERLDEGMADEFRKLIGLVVATLPVDALYADLSANSESVAPEALAPDHFTEIVEATWRILRQGGLTKSETEAHLRSADPFSGELGKGDKSD